MNRPKRKALGLPGFRMPGAAIAGSVLAVSSLMLGCASSPIAAPAPKEHPEARFLPSPLAGYALSVAALDAQRLRDANAALVSGGDPARALEVAKAFLAASSGFEPAVVLEGQARFVGRDLAGALEAVLPVARDNPEYLAAQLLAARAAERLERIPLAYEHYLAISGRSQLAARLAATLKPRALEILDGRVRDLIARQHWQAAADELARVEAWAPEGRSTLELVAAYAEAAGESERALTAVRRLATLEGGDDLRLRLATLELEVGDAGAGLRLLEELARERPEDAAVQAHLDQAKLRWRMGLLPSEVRDIFRRPRLTRAEFAKLLFWMYPEVRYGRLQRGRIASDVLEHPHRQEIVRVVNLGLMDIDRTLHSFRPDRELTRGESVEAVLRVLHLKRPRPACLGDFDPDGRMSVESACSLAFGCGLLDAAGDCLPGATASGGFIERMGFAGLDILGSR